MGKRINHTSGCQLCKMHKNRHHGHAVKKTWQELKKLGKKRRISRHDVGMDA